MIGMFLVGFTSGAAIVFLIWCFKTYPDDLYDEMFPEEMLGGE